MYVSNSLQTMWVTVYSELPNIPNIWNVQLVYTIEACEHITRRNNTREPHADQIHDKIKRVVLRQVPREFGTHHLITRSILQATYKHAAPMIKQ
jgi:hypothetical protein